MADNITITSGTGVTVATDDVGGSQHQYVKVEFGADNTATKVTNTVPLPVSGTTIAITSLPALGIGSAVTVSNLGTTPLTMSGTTIAITSLPALGIGSAVTISNLSTVPLTVSGTTIAITSLPDLGVGSSVAITSLPDFATGTSVLATVTNAGTFAAQITSLPDFATGTSVLATVTNAGIFATTPSHPTFRFEVGESAPLSGYVRFTSTFTSAQTNAVLLALPASTTAIHVTDYMFSNAQTHGNFTFLESPSNGAVRPILDRALFRDYGGMVQNMSTPIVLDTNSALIFTTRSATVHSVFVQGYVL